MTIEVLIWLVLTALQLIASELVAGVLGIAEALPLLVLEKLAVFGAPVAGALLLSLGYLTLLVWYAR